MARPPGHRAASQAKRKHPWRALVWPSHPRPKGEREAGAGGGGFSETRREGAHECSPPSPLQLGLQSPGRAEVLRPPSSRKRGWECTPAQEPPRPAQHWALGVCVWGILASRLESGQGCRAPLGPDSPQAAGHGGAGSEACRLPCLAEAGGQNDGFEVSLVQSSVIVSLLCTPPPLVCKMSDPAPPSTHTQGCPAE